MSSNQLDEVAQNGFGCLSFPIVSSGYMGVHLCADELNPWESDLNGRWVRHDLFQFFLKANCMKGPSGCSLEVHPNLGECFLFRDTCRMYLIPHYSFQNTEEKWEWRIFIQFVVLNNVFKNREVKTQGFAFRVFKAVFLCLRYSKLLEHGFQKAGAEPIFSSANWRGNVILIGDGGVRHCSNGLHGGKTLLLGQIKFAQKVHDDSFRRSNTFGFVNNVLKQSPHCHWSWDEIREDRVVEPRSQNGLRGQSLNVVVETTDRQILVVGVDFSNPCRGFFWAAFPVFLEDVLKFEHTCSTCQVSLCKVARFVSGIF